MGVSRILLNDQVGDTDPMTEENDTNAFWDLLQMATSIFCACAPMYRAMGPLAGFLAGVWIRLKSVVSSQGSNSKSRSNIMLSNFRISSGRGKDRDGKDNNGGDNTPAMPPTWSRLADYP